MWWMQCKYTHPESCHSQMSSGSSLARQYHVSCHLCGLTFLYSTLGLSHYVQKSWNNIHYIINNTYYLLSTLITFNYLIYLSKYCNKCLEKRKLFLSNADYLLLAFSTHISLEPTSSMWPSTAHTALWPWTPLLLAVLLHVIEICSTDTAGIACTFESNPHNKYQFILLFHEHHTYNLCMTLCLWFNLIWNTCQI